MQIILLEELFRLSSVKARILISCRFVLLRLWILPSVNRRDLSRGKPKHAAPVLLAGSLLTAICHLLVHSGVLPTWVSGDLEKPQVLKGATAVSSEQVFLFFPEELLHLNHLLFHEDLCKNIFINFILLI